MKVMQIKDQIRAAREGLGMEMRELAQRANVVEQAVRHWESGRSYPRRSTEPLVEAALGIKLDYSHEDRDKKKLDVGAFTADDMGLLMVLCKLPTRAKRLFGELMRLHLEAVEPPPEAPDELPAPRRVAAPAPATKTARRHEAVGGPRK